ncbi:hypothetical protein AAHN93_03685 [Vandammella animalimorsus]|uniref:DUF7676 family protein n=1 Tax=Vandammella animalimorsus TaxID=2029117 RepID=UPI001EEDC6AE|nr:hypothetical protein [Vandammella animalimorsus]
MNAASSPPVPNAPQRRTDPDGSVSEAWPLPTDEDTLWMLLQDVFGQWWQQIHFGVCEPGVVYEIKAPNAPLRVGLLDGYATIDFGAWHFHLCIGEFKGVAPELAHARRTGRAELYRLLDRDGAPRSWGLRLFTHAGHQQLTVFLPNPFLTDEQALAATPDWSRLAAWNQLRSDYLNLPPDPADQSGKGFVCGG